MDEIVLFDANVIVDEMTKGNYSFLILMVGIIQILIMLWRK